jgi:hypothetical protein
MGIASRKLRVPEPSVRVLSETKDGQLANSAGDNLFAKRHFSSESKDIS